MYTKHIVLTVTLLFGTSLFAQVTKDTLGEVIVRGSSKSIRKSYSVTGNSATLTSKELLKAACCNLAESFETNPAIDVNYADAITGTKQIKMLGLTSPYLLISEENVPSVRGASQAYGLSFTPGTWVESIQITKGAGSVVNGFESISGQINTELLKPMDDIPFYLNLYGSSDARFEVNTHLTHKLSEKWATSLLLHGNTRVSKNDMNDDGFLDNPLSKQINFLNRWQYTDIENGWVSFINLRYMDDEKQMGELDFDKNRDRGTTNFWGAEINTERLDVSAKLGYVFPEMPYQSIGFQTAYNTHNQESYFGLRTYNIKQNSFYSNLILNSIISNTMNKFAAGINFSYDDYSEYFSNLDYSRIDNSVGAFFEYSYDNSDNFSVIAGIRADEHNRLGFFMTPRLHVRYNPWDQAVLRVSAGRGKRAANIFAENQQLLASSRSFDIQNNNGEIYGLNPEIAWNYGVSFMQKFNLFTKSAEVVFDFYRTDFQNKVVADLYQSPQQVVFYDVKGSAYANSFQAEFNLEIIKHLDLRTAYKFYDIATDYTNGKMQQPLQAEHRFFANLGFQTHILGKGQQWKFDLTYNWNGEQKLPFMGTNPIEYRLSENSPSFSLVNAQITRTFSSTFEIYVGGENVGNYKQPTPIVGSDAPFGTYFDSSIVYAPIFGQMYYAGLRFKIK